MKSVAAAFVFTIPVLSSVAVPALFAHELDHSNLLAELPSAQTRFWIQTSRNTSLEVLAAGLDLPLTALVELNEQEASETLSKGQWLILPNQVESRLSRSLSLDGSSIRRTAPVSAPPISVAEVKVRRGDSVATIAKTHGLSLTQFRRLNPGMDLARPVVGSTVRVAEAAPRQLLQPEIADRDRPVSQQQLLDSLPTLQTRFWIQTSRGTSLKALAAELDLPLTTLAVLNEQVASATLSKGQWLILPTQVESRLSRSVSLDVSSIRRTASVSAPPISVAEVKVRRGDSIATIARTHGLSLTQFRRLNPGMDLARLVVGSTVRVAEAVPRQLLAIRPSVPSGDSWPELPNLPGARVTRSAMPVGTPYSAPDSDQKQELRELIQKNRAAERLAAARKADAERQARVAREEKERQARRARMAAAARRYRKFDGSDCTYDWQSWGRSASGVRSVKSAYCQGVTEVAVDCSKLKVSLLRWGQWQPWKTPDPLMEPMVVEACSNLVSVRPGARLST